MYCIEKCLSFTLVPLKRNSCGEREFTFKNTSHNITYHSNFSYKHFALVDCITHYLRATIFHELYKNSDQDKPPFRSGDPRIPDNIKMFGPFIDKDFTKSFYINDDMIRSHPVFKTWRQDGWKIFNFLKETSEIEFEKFNYHYVLYDKQDNRFRYKPLQILEKCNLFDVSVAKKHRGCNLYKISFNSIFGKMFAYNVNVANFYLVRDNFYKLDSIAQSTYRFFGLFNNKKIDIEVDKLLELFEYEKVKENRNNLVKGFIKRFDNMKKLNLISDWKLKYDVFEIQN